MPIDHRKVLINNEIKLFFSLKRITFILLSLATIFLLASCAVKKSKKEQGPISKLYHNTTAKFNGYFNADVLVTESIKTLETSHIENYTKILPVYKYVASTNPTAVAKDLDEAIKKVTVVVSIHPYSNWSDDCYLLAGKAQYVKQDYESAEETLLYMSQEFSPEGMEKRAKESLNKKKNKKAQKKARDKERKVKSKDRKKKAKKRNKANKKKRKKAKKERDRKKKEREKERKARKKNKTTGKKTETKKKKVETEIKEPPPKTITETLEDKKAKEKAQKEKDKANDPENYFLKHRPAYQEGLLWLARTYIERESYEDADRLIGMLERDPKTFDDIKKQLAPVKAHYAIKRKRYEQAIPYLEEAIKLTKKKKEKARYHYIIAQIHQESGRASEALASFQDALKHSKSYVMEFSSKLNIIENSWLNGKTSSEQANKSLNRMLKDIKNEDYKDQIYYTLATIALKDNDKTAAIENLKNSLTYGTVNIAQKTESYLQLAELYYETESFVPAKLYFDSTLLVLPKTDERYALVSEYANSLTDIAKNIQIITEQDSLLRVSEMSDDERKALAFKMKKEEDELKRQIVLNQVSGAKKPVSRAGRSTGPPSNYWAYNDRAIKKGKRDFEKRWGSRSLEDNWRRSNSRSIEDLTEIGEAPEVIDRELTDEDVTRILKDIPSSPEQLAKSNKLVEDALFHLGTLYKDRLDNNKKSIESLEELLQRYPETEHKMEAWYFLHLAHTDLNNKTEAKKYYDLLVKNFPTSTYARVLTDPNFLAESAAEQKKLMDYYDATYDAFEKGQFKIASERISKVTQEFGPKNILQPKFALLQSMCLGNLKGKEDYIKSLKEVIAKYPSTPEETRAKEILRLLGQKGIGGKTAKKDGKGNGDSKYKVDDKKLHYFIVVIKDKNIKLKDAQNSVSDFNREFHQLGKLRVSNVYLGSKTGTPVLVIRRFKTKAKAMDYYFSVESNAASFLPEGTEYEAYPITQFNYRAILKSKNMDGYKEFFEDNYLN